MLTGAIENGCASCGNTASWEYNDLGLPTREVDRNGNVTTYQYNDHGLETSRTEAAGTAAARTITTQWDTELRLPLVVTEPGLRTAYTYDSRGRRLSMTETDTASGESRTITWRYHPDTGDVPGQLAEVDGPRTDVADVTHYEYDAQGNRTRVTNALGQVTEITAHDAYGRALTVVDPNGLVTNLAYDPRGRLLSRDVGGEVTTFEYDGVGNLTAVHLPGGGALHYEYDAAQRLVAIADEDGNRIEYTLDAAGNRVAQDVRDSGGVLVRTQQQVFDELDRLVRVVGAQGQTTRHDYDDNGNRIATTDPAGDATQQTFDALDRVTRVTDAMGGVTSYSYDSQDRITSVTDPNGNTTRYAYDGFGNRVEVDSPDSGISTYEHDAAGNVVARVDAKGQRAEHAYDALDRLVRTDYADGASVVYRWDEGANGSGRLAAIDETGPDGWTSTIEWAYDAHGRITERSQSANGVTLVTRHRYDSAGRRVETVYPSGRTVAYSYVDDELSGISVDGTTVLRDIEYQPFGPVAGWTWGDGDVHSREYDLDGRLTQHGLATGSEGGGIRTIDYTADDNIATITGPNIARSYGYDGLDRLVAANDPDRTDAYRYDANGNRLSRTVDGTTESYTIEAGSNRLLGVSGAREASYSYDANGSLVDDGEHSYAYSARNRLISVDGGTTAIYRYNALGQRIYKRTGSGVDYAALAAEYQALADEHRAEAESLQQQADQKRAAGDAAAAEAERLRAEAESLRTQAEQNEQEAATLAEEATRLRDEAADLVARAEAKEQEALPLQQEADRLSAEAAELSSQADAEWQAADDDQARADELAASAESRRAHADALDRQADENDRIAAEHRARVPELEAEADALRAEADEQEAAAQPYLREVEKLQRRIEPVQRVVDRFDARIEALRERKIDDPANRRQERRNAMTDQLIGVLERVRGRIQWRLDDWRVQQANEQAQADALLAEAAALRQQAEQNDQLAIELAQEADRLEAEAVELRAEAESERTLAAQEQAESEDYARQAQIHRDSARGFDDRAQAKEDEARPLAEQAATLRVEAESLRAQAETKVAEAVENEREADRLTRLAADERVTAGENEEQAGSLEADAIQYYGEADSLQGDADSSLEAAIEAQQQADVYAELTEGPAVASDEQYFVYSEGGFLVGRYDQHGNAVREYIRHHGTPVAVAADGSLYFLHTDSLGSPKIASRPNAGIEWSWVSSPFGDTQPDEDPDKNGEELTLNLRFPGQYFDETVRRNYNLWRYYNPGLGRYSRSDPIGIQGSINTYEYAINNPIRYADPFGLLPTLIPDNCSVVILDDESHTTTRSVKGDPDLVGRDIIISMALARKGIGGVFAYVERKFWMQVTFNYRIDVTDIEYYLRCVDEDECGNEIVSKDWGHDYSRDSVRLEDDVKRWTELDFEFEFQWARKRR